LFCRSASTGRAMQRMDRLSIPALGCKVNTALSLHPRAPTFDRFGSSARECDELATQIVSVGMARTSGDLPTGVSANGGALGSARSTVGQLRTGTHRRYVLQAAGAGHT